MGFAFPRRVQDWVSEGAVLDEAHLSEYLCRAVYSLQWVDEFESVDPLKILCVVRDQWH
jgi:hypothetical protein